jgi:hypothetical protein
VPQSIVRWRALATTGRDDGDHGRVDEPCHRGSGPRRERHPVLIHISTYNKSEPRFPWGSFFLSRLESVSCRCGPVARAETPQPVPSDVGKLWTGRAGASILRMGDGARPKPPFRADGSYADPRGGFFMVDNIRAITLNANQRRHFAVLFARLEDTIRRVERWLDAADEGAVLSLSDDDVAEPLRRDARVVLRSMKDRIAALALHLELSPRRQSKRRAIAAALTSEAIRLEDSVSQQLRGYGPVDESVAQQLDPILMDMARMLATLASAFNHDRRSERE